MNASRIDTGTATFWIALCGLTLWTAAPEPAAAGAFVFAGETNGIDLITHPTNYTGTETDVTVSVCVDPASANLVEMETSVRNVIFTYNAMVATQGNLIIPSPDLDGDAVDFESTALHEAGHCIGLAHPNAATESGLPGALFNYTKATNGADDAFNTDPGTDAVIGSGDDVRGDDVNLHWFRTSNNDPFTIDDPVDSTTYARDTAMLPGGDTFAANGDRDVAVLLGAGSTEAVMQQGAFSDEEQRELTHDDVASLLYARSGLDSLAGTADDYGVTLEWVGVTAACDVKLSFDNTQTGFAVCQTGGDFLSGDDVGITSANVFFNTGFNWFFNSERNDGSIFEDGFESGDTSNW
ncbi:MAG: hypothetical protein GY719_32805 [bacterium]|nr:hypothetical protein [bacterium]